MADAYSLQLQKLEGNWCKPEYRMSCPVFTMHVFITMQYLRTQCGC